jgi:hypothetical protein
MDTDAIQQKCVPKQIPYNQDVGVYNSQNEKHVNFPKC